MQKSDKLRILCLGPHRSPSNALLRARAFERMGHIVETFDPSLESVDQFIICSKFMRRVAPMLRLNLIGKTLLRKADTFQPQLVFVEKGDWLTQEMIRRLRKNLPGDLKVVHYNPDDPFGDYGLRGWDEFIKAIPSYDCHFVPKEENTVEYLERGARRVQVYDRAYDSNLHQPTRLSAADQSKYGCDVGFIGSWAPHRESVIAELIRQGYDLAVWGSRWQKGPHWARIKPHWRGPGQFDRDYVKAICGMRIALHFLRRENRDLQDSRTFEIPACGTFMLAERSPDHERLFEEGKEAEFFDNTKELIQKLTYYLAHPTEREKVASAGRQRCIKSFYSNEGRLFRLLEFTYGSSQ